MGATAGYDHTIRFWEPSGMCHRTIQHPDSQVNALAITPDREHLAAAGNPSVRMYEVHTQHASPVTSYDGHSGNVTSVGFHSECKWLYTGSEDGTVKVWDMRAAGCSREYDVGAPVNSALLHPNQGEIITADQDGKLSVFDLVADKCVYSDVASPDSALRSVSVDPDAVCLVTANNDGALSVYSASPSESGFYDKVDSFQAHDDYVLKVLFSPHGSLLATTSADKTIKLWDVAYDDDDVPSFSHASTLVGHKAWVWDCVFSADSAYLASASSDQVARLWNVSLGETIRQYTSHHKAVVTIALNDSTPDAAAASSSSS